jgi:hypothetical protein
VRTALAFLVVACLVPRIAHAGRSFYGWLYGTEVMPERGVELQTWIQEEDGKYGSYDKKSWFWWGPLVGITDQLELALPIELEWRSEEVSTGGAEATETAFTLKRFGIEARYRLVSQDPVEAPALAPLVRVAVKRDVTQRDMVRVEGDAVVSYEAGPVHALVDLGFISEIQPSRHYTEVRPGGGVSIRTTGELRLGVEGYAELGLDSSADHESWAAVGPNLSWTHGRFWLTGAFGVGVYHVSVAPRVLWGIAF